MTYTLKELRARKGWTQAETAERLEISTQTYNAWEMDFGKVKARNGAKVAKIFGVKIDEIFFNLELENNSSKKPDEPKEG